MQVFVLFVATLLLEVFFSLHLSKEFTAQVSAVGVNQRPELI